MVLEPARPLLTLSETVPHPVARFAPRVWGHTVQQARFEQLFELAAAQQP